MEISRKDWQRRVCSRSLRSSIFFLNFQFFVCFNCNYPVVSQHVNHLFLSFHQVSRERIASPHGEKRKKKFHIDALWVEMIRNWRVGYSVIRSSTRSFARPLNRSLVRSLVRSHRSLVRSYRTARFAHGKEVYFYQLHAPISCSFNPLCDGIVNSAFIELG